MSFSKEQLLPGENLIILARQHWLVLFRPVLLNVIILAVITGITYFSGRTWFLTFFLVPLVYLLWEYLAWHRREYILTDRRVVKQEGVFSTSSFDAPLDKINNVFHNQSFMGRIWKYGDVGLETASEQGTTVFDFLSRPLDFKNEIVRQREVYNANARPGAATQKSVPQLIDELASLRDRSIITEAEFQEKKRTLLGKM
jgi:uncharacterized membrane protein YdbT with pleckstrin-like domain